MRAKHFQRNEVIFHRDDPAGHVYLIASGTVKVSVPEEGGQEVVIALHRGGDVFGEISLFDEGPRSATVTAMTETMTFALANQDFMDVRRGESRARGSRAPRRREAGPRTGRACRSRAAEERDPLLTNERPFRAAHSIPPGSG